MSGLFGVLPDPPRRGSPALGDFGSYTKSITMHVEINYDVEV